jgi:hypothetical protein
MLLQTSLSAGSMFTLSGVKKVYPVVEISGKKVPKTLKPFVYEELKSLTESLGIDSSGYDQRALAVVVSDTRVKNSYIVTVKLIVGERVTRSDSDKKTFALTYNDSERFIIDNNNDVSEQLEDSLDILFSKFSDQYSEENKKVKDLLVITEDNFAVAMGYETNYKKAVLRAKKEKKNIMLVLVSNFCPWCRKFEQRVLLKKEVNAMIQANYIPLIINKEKEAFPKQLDMSFTPIVHFLDYKNEQSYERVVGYNSREEFLYFLKKDTQK